MRSRWIEMERHRLQCVGEWPESEFRRVTLAGILYSLERLGELVGSDEKRPPSGGLRGG